VAHLGDIIRRRAEVVARETPEGAVLVDLIDGDCFEMNRVGASFWTAIEAPRRLDEICDAIGSRFNVPRDILERDVLALVEMLAQADLVKVEVPLP
jgi:hypothetical protein